MSTGLTSLAAERAVLYQAESNTHRTVWLQERQEPASWLGDGNVSPLSGVVTHAADHANTQVHQSSHTNGAKIEDPSAASSSTPATDPDYLNFLHAALPNGASLHQAVVLIAALMPPILRILH